MKSPIIFRNSLRHLLLPLILLVFMPVKAADYTLSFSDGADDDIEASPVTIKSSIKSFLVTGTSHHYSNIARRLEWSSSNGHSAHYELLAGDAAGLAEFDCPFATRTCSPVRVTCEIYDVEIDGHISHFNSRYVWEVNVGYDFDITPTTAWQTHSSSHGEDLGKNYRVPILEGYVYTFKTGCGDGATSNYSTHLIIQNSGCSQLAYDNSGCGSNGATVSYTSSSSGYIYVIVKGTLGGWGEPSAGGSYTLAYRRQSCIPGAVTVSGGGTYCANSRGLNATGGSGGTIYFQGKNSNGVSTENPGTSATVTSSGTYYFRARSDAGCWGTPGSATVTLNPIPDDITVTGGGTVCGRTTLTASGGEPGTIYYQGTTTHGASTSDPSTSELVNTSGTYYFRARTAAGCWGPQGSATVTVLPQPGAVTVSGGGTFCNDATLTATGGSGGTIYWQARNSNGTLTEKPQTSHTVTSSGTYYFRAMSTAGCWGKQGSATVTINKPGDVTVSGGGTYCGTTTLTASGGSGGTIYYQGNVSNGTSTTKPGTTATVSSSGTYYFRARTAGGCWGDQGSATVTIGVPEATTVSGGGTYCGSATLTASGGAGGTLYYQGTTSNGTSTAEPAASKTVSSSGTYYFRARNSGGCWGNQGSATVTINSAPAATAVSGGGTSCGSVTLSASGGSGGTIYYQGTTSGGTNTAEPATSKTISASGTYYFRARSSGGCWGEQGSATVTIAEIPSLTVVAGGGTACNSKMLTASGGSGGTVYYQGTTSNGTSILEPTESKTVNASGTYYFRARSSGGCWGEQGSATVTIKPVPGATSVSGGGSYCNSATLNASGGSGGTIYFQGTITDGSNTSAPSVSQTVTSSGTYYFRAQSADGCWGPQGNSTVTIKPAPGATTVSGEGSFCSSTTLNASGGSGGTIYFQGTTANGTSTADPATSKTISASGTYYFRARSNEGCWGQEDDAAVIISSGYTASVSIQVSPGDVIDQGAEVTFSAINENDIPSPVYQWKLNGNTIGPNTGELKISGLHDGDQVSCTMTSEALCVNGVPVESNTITMTVNVTNAMEEASWANSLLIYPNPSHGEFMIVMKIPQSENIALKLLNMTGQVIHAEELKTQAGDYSMLLSVDRLVPGVYNLQLQSGSTLVCRRILIE